MKVDSVGIHTTEVEANGVMLGQTLSEHIVDTDKHVTVEDKKKWDAKSDFSGIYEDLKDKPNISDDSSGKLHIADEAGNVIAEVDESGVKTSTLTANNAVIGGVDIKSSIDEHKDDTEKHITSEERTKWNNKSDFSGIYDDLEGKPNITPEYEDKSLSITDNDGNILARFDENGLDTIIVIAKEAVVNGKDVESTLDKHTDDIKGVNDALSKHTDDNVVHITSSERTIWNAAKTHADSAHAPSNAEVNQNAFSNVVVGSTTIAADAKTDTLTMVAGSNITLTPDATNDKITISATDTVYTHPNTSGNKHIPSGGSSGQILRWSSDGTAVWGADNNTTYSVATSSVNGLMSSTDKTKLDSIEIATVNEVKTYLGI